MTNNEPTFNLATTENGLHFIPAKVTFSDFPRLMSEAQRLNDLLYSVQVDEDNIKISKKLVAGVRKKVDELNRIRIDKKKEVLTEYLEFEDQVKEITDMVSEGESIVRSKVRVLEELEREAKQADIKILWNERAYQYEFTEWFGFDQWYEPRFANKSMSINKVEENLVEWLEKVRNDVMVIDADPLREDLMVLYAENKGNLTEAMLTLRSIQSRKQQMAQTKQVKEVTKKINKVYNISVYSEADYLALVAWMNSNEIKYTKDIKNI